MSKFVFLSKKKKKKQRQKTDASLKCSSRLILCLTNVCVSLYRPCRGASDVDGLSELVHQPVDLPGLLQLQVSPRSAGQARVQVLGRVHSRDLRGRQPRARQLSPLPGQRQIVQHVGDLLQRAAWRRQQEHQAEEVQFLLSPVDQDIWSIKIDSPRKQFLLSPVDQDIWSIKIDSPRKQFLLSPVVQDIWSIKIDSPRKQFLFSPVVQDIWSIKIDSPRKQFL